MIPNLQFNLQFETNELVNNKKMKSNTTAPTSSTTIKKHNTTSQTMLVNNTNFIPSPSENPRLFRKVQETSYEPTDPMERFLFTHSSRDRKLLFTSPTHISQRGGHYHLDISQHPELADEYFRVWRECVEKKHVFYVEEIRKRKNFKLYLDLDFKLKKSEGFNLKGKWLDLIHGYTRKFFGEDCNYNLAITHCHGVWENDQTCPECTYKSGYRLYYYNIKVPSMEVYENYLKQLIEYLKSESMTYTNKPSNWNIEDIIDTNSVKYPRCRMFGTVKYRNCKNIGRQYKYYGMVKDDRTTTTSIDIDKDLSNEFKNLSNILPITSFL